MRGSIALKLKAVSLEPDFLGLKNSSVTYQLYNFGQVI